MIHNSHFSASNRNENQYRSSKGIYMIFGGSFGNLQIGNKRLNSLDKEKKIIVVNSIFAARKTEHNEKL